MRQLKYRRIGQVFDKLDDRIYYNVHQNLSRGLVYRVYDRLRRPSRRTYDWLYVKVRKI